MATYARAVHNLPCGHCDFGIADFGCLQRIREVVMITRRGFTGFASCAICSLAGFIATEASAQNASTPTASGVKRTVLSQLDGPVPGYVTINMEVEIDPGVTVPRHTHPGIESTYVLEGEIELPVQGQPIRVFKAGDGFQIPPETPHAGGKPSDKKLKFAITYVVLKDKPLVSPA
jgi:quercetin dioxygenase-like cupin family protein